MLLLTREYWKFVYYCSGKLDDRWKKEGQERHADIVSAYLRPQSPDTSLGNPAK